MKSTLILLLMAVTSQLFAAGKDETQKIAKGIQCTYLREKSFLNIDEMYSFEKSNPEYIKKVSDSIYAQAFKICDPENTNNANKEILSVCTTGCDQFILKGVLGLGGSSVDEIEKCKKMCLNYSDLLSHHYSAANTAVKKYIEMNPPEPKKVEQPAAAVVAPAASAPVEIKEEIKEEKKKD